MGELEKAVARHYGRPGLLTAILDGLQAAGLELETLRSEDLAPVDAFHIGGRQATAYAAAKLGLGGGEAVLDIGCGLGGTCRYLAETQACQVTGLDLTPDYIGTARALTEMTGLGAQIRYEVGSALYLPFAAQTFDAALTIHIAMNIADRASFYDEAARVLKPGGRFCLYDVMVGAAGLDDLRFPVPWAATPATSHLTSIEATAELLEGAGFEILETEDRSGFAKAFIRDRLGKMAGGLPPLGLHLLLGEQAWPIFENLQANLEAGHIAPVVMLARAPGSSR